MLHQMDASLLIEQTYLLDKDFDSPINEWIERDRNRRREMEELDELGY